MKDKTLKQLNLTNICRNKKYKKNQGETFDDREEVNMIYLPTLFMMRSFFFIFPLLT